MRDNSTRFGKGKLMTWKNDLAAVASDMRPRCGEGRVADYIPALARVDAHKFGIAGIDSDGVTAGAGDSNESFSIQSVSKVFGLTLALMAHGDNLWRRVWREPSGTSFNSIILLESNKGIPRNPFVNAGALVVTDVLVSKYGRDGATAEILSFVRTITGNPAVEMDTEVAQSEAETGHRNAGLAHVMKGFGNIENPVDDVLHVYFHQCSLALTCADLARAGLYLACGGIDPISGKRVVPALMARRINALMLTCGHYDAAGDFAYKVGLPGKSGVGGGILAIVPNRLSLGVWSPGLNEYGNSLVGSLALEDFVRRTGVAIF